MTLALLYERRYELDGDEQQLNAAALALKKMHELDPADPRARQILERLLQTRQKRQAE
jgi:hypothetical protein